MSWTHSAPPNTRAYGTPADVLTQFSHYVQQTPNASQPSPDYSSVPIKTRSETSGVAPHVPFYGKATSPPVASGDVPADYSLGWNDGRLEEGYFQDLNRTSTAQTEIDSLRRSVYHDSREHPPEATLACKFHDDEISSLQWNDGKKGHVEQKHAKSTWHDEVPHAWLRNDAVDGTFQTPLRTLHIEQTLKSVEEIEKSLHPDIVALIVQQASEEKEDWNAYFEQYYRIVSSNASSLGVSITWISVLIVLAAHVRQKLKSRYVVPSPAITAPPSPAITAPPSPAITARPSLPNSAQVYLIQLDQNIAKMYYALLDRKKDYMKMHMTDIHKQHEFDKQKLPLYSFKTPCESYAEGLAECYEKRNTEWTSALTCERLPLRMCDRGIKPAPDVTPKRYSAQNTLPYTGRQEAMSRKGLPHHSREIPAYGSHAHNGNQSYFSNNWTLHGIPAEPYGQYRQVSRVPENMRTCKEDLYFALMETEDDEHKKRMASFMEKSDAIDEKIAQALRRAP